LAWDNSILFLGVVSRASRPSPNTAQVDIITTNESQLILTDSHYDRLEAMLIEKIETYVQGGMKTNDIPSNQFLLFFSF